MDINRRGFIQSAAAGETVRVDPAAGTLAKGSPGSGFWAREYEKGWEMSV